MSEIRFSRRLSLWQVMARGMGVMVITAAFVLLGDVLAASGPLTPLALLLALLLLLANVLGYVELAGSSSRAGSAYVQTREAEGGWIAFLTGWVLIQSGVGLCALLAHGFGVQVTILIRDHLNLALPVWPWAAGLVLLLGASNALGTQQGRRRLVTVPVLLMAFLVGFALLAAPHIELDHYRVGPRDWEKALTLLLAPCVGLEIAAGLQNELRQRARSSPRALLLTPALTTMIVVMVAAAVIGVVGPEALIDSQNPLALLGASVVPGAGRPLILAVGALGLALALNSVLVLVVRQIYVMGKDGYWPADLLRVHPRFGTPVWVIILVTLIVLPLSAIPIHSLSRLVGLLYLIVLMGVNLTLVLRPQSQTSPFRLPFHPWVPALALVIDVLVIPLWGWPHLVWGAGCVGLGITIYLTYAQSHHIEAKEGVTVFKPSAERESKPGYCVLVPIANPATAGALMHLAGILARRQEGEVLALQVVTVPDQVPLEEGRHSAAISRVLLERAMAQAKEEGFAIQTMTRVAHTVAEGVLDTAREEAVDMILLGWRGYTRSAGASMGAIIDAVIRDAPCDVTVAKGREWEAVSKILVPTAGGPNAPIAAHLAWLLSEVYGSEVTALNVQLGRATPERMEENRQRIEQTLNGLEFSRPPEKKVVVAESVVEGIVREAQGYDLILLGASEEGLFDQFAFGSIPQQIAARVPKTAVIVKRYRGPTDLWTRRLMQGLLQLLPRLNVEEQLELREVMRDSAQPGVSYFVLITLSGIIAALGLLLDSPAVVIGAMLVAPLMSPILGFSLGMVLGDVRLIRLSIEAVLKGVALAVIIGVFVGVFSPLKEMTDQIIARTQPTLLDLVVALASGMAGAYALGRKEVGAALPGVAIAAALMPPLAVVGLGLALGNPQVVGGAFLLFITNLTSISLAGVIVFILLGIRPQTWLPEARRQIRRGLMGFALLLIALTIPLAVIMTGIVRETARRNVIHEALAESVIAQRGELVDFEYQTERDELVVVLTTRSDQPIDQETVDALAAALEQRLNLPLALEVVTLPVVRSTE